MRELTKRGGGKEMEGGEGSKDATKLLNARILFHKVVGSK